jgi:hypothetical protein
LALYVSVSFTNSGNSATHGPHQVAQKFTTTTLPAEALIIPAYPAGFSGNTFGAEAATGTAGFTVAGFAIAGLPLAGCDLPAVGLAVLLCAKP